jgi:hypothetical protein
MVARPQLKTVAQKLCACEHNVFRSRMCTFSNITSHRNNLLLFVKHLAVRILSWRSEQDNNTPTGNKISRHWKCFWQEFIERQKADIMALHISIIASGLTMEHGCNNSISHLFCRSVCVKSFTSSSCALNGAFCTNSFKFVSCYTFLFSNVSFWITFIVETWCSYDGEKMLMSVCYADWAAAGLPTSQHSVTNHNTNTDNSLLVCL